MNFSNDDNNNINKTILITNDDNNNINKTILNELSYDILNEIISYMVNKNDILIFYNLNKYTMNYKYDTYYYNFNVVYSLKYYNDNDYRNYVQTKVNTLQRMSLNYFKNDNINDINRLDNVHALYLSKCSNIIDVQTKYVSILDCSYTSIEDLNNIICYNLHTLDLTGCDLSNNDDLSCLNGINNVNLCKTNVSDVSSLSHINILNLSHNKLITDFSMLGGIYELDLSHTNIKDKDLKYLSNVHTLILKSTDITNVNDLIHNTTLDLSITLVTDVSSLSRSDTLYSLNLSDTKVIDVNVLSKIKTLQILILDNCRSIINVNDLGKLTCLRLSATNVKDIFMLGNVNTLDLSYCSNIHDVSCLKNVKKLILTGNGKLDTSMLNANAIICNSNLNVQNIEVEGNVD